MQTTDYLLIGSGVAGLSLAIKLAERYPERKITVCTKGQPSDGSTDFAQGGIAVVTDFEKDSFEKHIQDTLVCGHFTSAPEVVKKVVEDAPSRYQDLVKWGFRTDVDSHGNIKLGREGGHSEDRIIHYKDQTGHEIERALLAYCQIVKNIHLLSHHFAVDLLKENNQCVGAIIADENEELFTLTARNVILATGGIGQVYGHTTNPSVSTGDGIAMAQRMGAQVEDMEFVQFHPTAMYLAEPKTTFLISEAVRGAGAILRNSKGEAFMLQYDERGDLAPRDIVSQCIVKELEKQEAEYVYLDCTHLDSAEFETHFPMIKNKCLENGIDVHQDYIPVAPAQHYLCGGIVVDEKGATNIPHLYACGECTKTGLHGANRLASNSLLEALIYADSIAKEIEDTPLTTTSTAVLPSYFGEFSIPIEETQLHQLKKELNLLMLKNAGIVRDEKQMKATKERLCEMHQTILHLLQTTQFHSATWELRNLIEVAQLIIGQSLARKKSIGTFKILRSE